MKILVTMVSMVMLSACASDYKVKSVDTEIVGKGAIGSRIIGLNDSKEVIIQEENDAADELRVQEAVNAKMVQDLEYESFELKSCRNDLADPRLSGNGTLPPVAEIDEMKQPEQVKEEIGITDDGDLKVVKKSYFIDKLKLERKFASSLKKMITLTTRHKEECSAKMAIARRNAGLPGTRYQGTGYFTESGAWVQTRQNESSLDDGFAIKATFEQKDRL